MKANYNICFADTMFGSIQNSIEAIIDEILSAVKDGKDLDQAIRFADCQALNGFSDETPIALPLGGEDGKTIGLTIQCNEWNADEGYWETFDLLTVEIAAFAEISHRSK